jgi:hypothetical protein
MVVSVICQACHYSRHHWKVVVMQAVVLAYSTVPAQQGRLTGFAHLMLACLDVVVPRVTALVRLGYIPHVTCRQHIESTSIPVMYPSVV